MIQLDILKGLAIIGVVAGHCDVLKNFFYVFHVPLFFFVAGVFAKPAGKDIHELWGRTGKHFRRYWLPFVILQTMALLLHNFFWHIGWYTTPFGDGSGITAYIRQLLRIITFGGGEQLLGALWFLIVLCEITIGVDLLLFSIRKWTRERQIILLSTIAIVCHLLGAYTTFPRSLSRALYFLVYYLLGYVMRNRFRQYICESGRNFERIILLICLFLSVCLLAWNEISYEDASLLPLPLMGALCGIYTLCLVATYCAKNWIASTLAFVGKHSFAIMAFHFVGFKIVVSMFACIGLLSQVLTSVSPTPPNLALWMRLILLLGGIGIPIVLTMIYHTFIPVIFDVKK